VPVPVVVVTGSLYHNITDMMLTLILFHCVLHRYLVWLSLSSRLIQNIIVTLLDEVELMVCDGYFTITVNAVYSVLVLS